MRTNRIKQAQQFFSENTQKVYSTVRMDDPQLVERLYNAGASFGEVKPKEVSPWFSTLIMFVVFFLLWQFVMKKAMSKMGGIGNAMAFGKSNAKVYVKAQTGKTFKDVAGQDEARTHCAKLWIFCIIPRNIRKSAHPCQRVHCS